MRATTLTDPIVSSPKISEAPTRLVQVGYQADIAQETGEDWEGVSLTLSTASYRPPRAVPSITPWRITAYKPPFVDQFRIHRTRRGFSPIGRSRSRSPTRVVARGGFNELVPIPVSVVDPPSPERRRHSRSRSRSSRYRRSRSRSRSWDSVRHRRRSRSPVARAFDAAQNRVVVREGLISASFDINGLSNVPSDNASHKVSVAVSFLCSTQSTSCSDWHGSPIRRLFYLRRSNGCLLRELLLLPSYDAASKTTAFITSFPVGVTRNAFTRVVL